MHCSYWRAVCACANCHFARGAIHTCLFQLQQKELVACVEAGFISPCFRESLQGPVTGPRSLCAANFWPILHGLLNNLLFMLSAPWIRCPPYLLDSGLFVLFQQPSLCTSGTACIPLFPPKTVVPKITVFCVGDEKPGALLHCLPKHPDTGYKVSITNPCVYSFRLQ